MYYHMHMDGSDASVADFRRSIANINTFFDFNKIIDKNSKITSEHRKWFEDEALSDKYADAYNHVYFDEEKESSIIAWGVDGNVRYAAEKGIHDLYFVFEGKKKPTQEFMDALNKKAKKIGVKVSIEDRSPEYSRFYNYSVAIDYEKFEEDAKKLRLNGYTWKPAALDAKHYPNKPYIELTKEEADCFGINANNACLFRDGFVCAKEVFDKDTLETLRRRDDVFTKDTTFMLPLVEVELEKAPAGKRFIISNSGELFGDTSTIFINEVGLEQGGSGIVSKLENEFRHYNSYLTMYLVQKGSDEIVKATGNLGYIESELSSLIKSDIYQLDTGSVISGKLKSKTNGYQTTANFYNEKPGDGVMYIIITPGCEGKSYELDTDDGRNYKVTNIVTNRTVTDTAAYPNTNYDMRIEDTIVTEKTMKKIEAIRSTKKTIDAESFERNPRLSRNEVFKKYVLKNTPVQEIIVENNKKLGKTKSKGLK